MGRLLGTVLCSKCVEKYGLGLSPEPEVTASLITNLGTHKVCLSEQSEEGVNDEQNAECIHLT
jgi:hypothetical protein